MLYTTQGIVLNYIRYRDTSIIAKIFTKDFGLQSYVIYSIRKQKSRYSMNLFQPLTPLDMVVFYKKGKNIQSTKEIKYLFPTYSVLNNIQKATTALFIAEVLTKVIHEEVKNEPLFQFILQFIITLNQQTKAYQYLHITFMLHLCTYLGFGINTVHTLNLQLCESKQHPGIFNKDLMILELLFKGENRYEITPPIKTTIKKLLAAIITFYHLHIDTFKPLKSLPVLQALDA